MRKIISLEDAKAEVNRLLILGRLIKELEGRLEDRRGDITIWTELYDLRQRRNGIIEKIKGEDQCRNY